MKLDCVVILGPSGEFHPFVTEDFPKFTLPFMNIPLLNLTLNYLCPFASKVFIVCLEKYVKKLGDFLKYDVDIEIVTTPSYEGMGFILNMLKGRIKTPRFVLCKADLYGLEPLNTFLESCMHSDDDIYVSIIKTKKESPVMCIDSKNYLKMYNSSEIPTMKGQRYLLTKEYAIKDFFIIKSDCIFPIDRSLYCFKNNILPFLIQIKLKIRVGENMVMQIKDMDDYMVQFDVKNHLLGSSESYVYNLVDSECLVSDNVEIEDSIIGSNVVIGNGCVIKKSIVMDGTVIENDCNIESCIIGKECVIHGKSELKNCKVANRRIFKHSVKACSIVFAIE